jgi:Bifunctional DNA primase/polymerase, N-terminal
MGTFLEIATPLIRRGIPVIPVRPFSKRGVREDQFEVATTDIDVVEAWNHENSAYNVGCVGTLEGVVILDADNSELIARIERETGHKMPRTFTVRSGGKKLPHLYFRQTEMSRAIGNKKASGSFDLQSTNKYVVGPGSMLEDGGTYDVIDESPIADFPEWLAYWILENADETKSKMGDFKDAPPVHPDFDFDAWCEHYRIDYFGEGKNGKHILRACPVKGDCHTTDGRPDYAACVIFYDGERLGFSDLATSCEGSNLTIGGLVHWLNTHGHEPYRGVIWENDNADLLNDPRFAAEDAELAENPTANNDPMPDLDSAWEERAKELNPPLLPVPDDIDSLVKPPQAEGLAFDGRALYGRLGEMARATGLPLGWMYPALLGMASALNIRAAKNEVRANMFVALIAPVGMAKTVVLDAADKTIFLPELTKTYTTPASDRGLVKLLGEDGNTVLLIEDEFRSVLSKCQVPNSNLAQVICKLWSKDKGGVADKKGVDRCIGKLCMVGNLPADDGADFSKVFGSSTVTGMYDRFLFGYDTTAVKYRSLDIKTQFFTDEMIVRIPAWVWDAKDRWGGDNMGRRRLTEHALRVALVTAAVNGDREITAGCLAAAFRFVEWQERLRAKFRPGLAETKEAECLEAVYHALLEQHQKQKAAGTFPKGADLIGRGGESLWRFLNYTDVVKSRNLYRKYGSMVTRIKNIMVEDGILERIKEIETNEKGEESEGKGTPFYVLRKSL